MNQVLLEIRNVRVDTHDTNRMKSGGFTMRLSVCQCFGLLFVTACTTLAPGQVSNLGPKNTEYLRKLSTQSTAPAGLITSPVLQTTSPLQQPAKFAALKNSFKPINQTVNDPLAAKASSLEPVTTQPITSQSITTQSLVGSAIASGVEPASHIQGCVGCDVLHPAGACGESATAVCGAWTHYSSVFVEGLYLRPRNAEIAYAVPIDGPITQTPANNPIQVGRVGVVDHDYEFNYAVGGSLALDPMSSIAARYSTIDFSSTDSVSTSAPDVIRSIVSHPSTDSVSSDFLSATANLEIDYDTIDLLYRHLFVGGENYAVNYSLGGRYGKLDQRFHAQFVNGGTEDVMTDVDFEGLGLRLGFDAERHSCRNRLLVYAKGAANFIAGRFRASYFQGSSFDPEIVNTNWEAGRIVPALDIEIGIGYRSLNDRIRLTAGYRVDTWFNMVTNEDFVWAVQQNNFLNLEDSISFDGLVTRLELRF